MDSAIHDGAECMSVHGVAGLIKFLFASAPGRPFNVGLPGIHDHLLAQPRPRGPAEFPRQPAAQQLHGGGGHAAGRRAPSPGTARFSQRLAEPGQTVAGGAGERLRWSRSVRPGTPCPGGGRGHGGVAHQERAQAATTPQAASPTPRAIRHPMGMDNVGMRNSSPLGTDSECANDL